MVSLSGYCQLSKPEVRIIDGDTVIVMPSKLGNDLNQSFLKLSDSLKSASSRYKKLETKYLSEQIKHIEYQKGAEAKLVANKVLLDQMNKYVDDERRRHKVDRVIDWVAFTGLVFLIGVYADLTNQQ